MLPEDNFQFQPTSAGCSTIGRFEPRAQVTSPFPTQTPVAVSPARTEPFAYGVASGDVTQTTAILWTRTPGAVGVVAELSTTAAFDQLQALLGLAAIGEGKTVSA